MRDGVELSADLFLPRGAGRCPTVLIRTPYSNNNAQLIEKGTRLAAAGYACVIQDVRGRWDSGGDYYPFKNEAEDGFDTQKWVGSQDFSDGTVGTAGAWARRNGGARRWAVRISSVWRRVSSVPTTTRDCCTRAAPCS